MKEILL